MIRSLKNIVALSVGAGPASTMGDAMRLPGRKTLAATEGSALKNRPHTRERRRPRRVWAGRALVLSALVCAASATVVTSAHADTTAKIVTQYGNVHLCVN